MIRYEDKTMIRSFCVLRNNDIIVSRSGINHHVTLDEIIFWSPSLCFFLSAGFGVAITDVARHGKQTAGLTLLCVLGVTFCFCLNHFLLY